VTTAGDLISEASAQLHGWGSTSDRITPLSVDLTAIATDSFTIDFAFGQAVGITPGVVEIDSELLYVTAVDATTGICTLANGFGRAYGGSTAAAHTAGSKVVSRPRFPRLWLLKQMNEIISATYPQLFVPNTYATTVKYPSDTYILPSTNGTPMTILDAQWQLPIGNWTQVGGYELDPYDATFRLRSGAMIGRPLRIIFATRPRLFVAESDDFVIQTGLPVTATDVLTLGVVAKQVPGLDVSRAQTTTVEQQARSTTVPPFAGIKTAQYLMAEFQQRLANEATALRRQYRPRIVRTVR
jgi:hypothetical protein